MNAIDLVGVEKRYGRTRALHGIDLALATGRLYLLQGPNGAGKSTLLRVAAGLARPSRGRVRVLGADPFRADQCAVRGRVGFLGAEPGLYAELSVRENLRLCARLFGAEAGRVDARILELGLVQVADRPLRQLSFGYRRRAGLARALLHETDLLLLDEPWNGLDDLAAQRLAEQLELKRASGRTAVVAAHSVGAFAALFDHTLRLERGRLIEDTPLPEILADAPERAEPAGDAR